MHTMPEVGTVMSVCMGSGDEESCFGTNLLPFTGFTHPSTTKPDRHVLRAYDHEFGLSSDDISFTIEDGSGFSATDNGLSWLTSGALTIQTDQTLKICGKNVYTTSEEDGVITNSTHRSQFFLATETGDMNILSPSGNLIKYGLARNPLESFYIPIQGIENVPPPPPPPDPPRRSFWGSVARVVGAVAVVAVVAVATVVTGGAALKVVGAIALSAAKGAGIGAVTGVGVRFAVDAWNVAFNDGEWSSWQDYLHAALDGAVTGAIFGAFAGIPGFANLPMLDRMSAFFGVGVLSDLVIQLPGVIFDGQEFNAWQTFFSGTLSFIGAGIPDALSWLFQPSSGSGGGGLQLAFSVAGNGGGGSAAAIVASGISSTVTAGSAAVGANLANVLFSRGSNSGRNRRPNQDALDEMRRLEETCRNVPGFDCSEIAEDLFDASGGRGRVIEIRSNSGKLSVMEYGSVDQFDYHTVFSDGKFIFDPRFSSNPILEADYFDMIRRLNPSGFDITITHP